MALKMLEDAEIENIAELTIERNQNIPPLISALYDADNIKLVEHIKLCMKYLCTYTVSEAIEDLLQHVVLAIKQSLQKLYEDNILLSDTADDDIVIDILREKLQVAVSFLNTIKTILNFLTENGDKPINLNTLNDVPVNLLEVIFGSFEHCKNSADEYKTILNTELLEIFYSTQEAHVLILKLFDSCIVVPTDTSVVTELNKEIICKMSDILSEISIKSMSDNWKGYIAIVQKFAPLLDNTFDLKIPVQSLTHLIGKNLNSLSTDENMHTKTFTQVVKIASFLVKVALKIFDIFWNYMEKITLEVLILCCVIYRYASIEIRCKEGFPSENILLLESSLINPLEPFLLRLVTDPLLINIYNSGTQTLPDEYNFGFIIFLNNILHCLVVCEHRPEKFDVVPVTSAIFKSIKQCFADFFLDKHSTRNIFDELVLNITAGVLLYGGYPMVELILFENILQEHIWSALLAIEVWTLLLYNSNSQICLTTLVSLIRKLQEIDFGVYTNRIEKVYLKCLIQRIFLMLPPHMKNDAVEKCCPRKNTDIWQMIGFHNFSFQQKSAIEDVCADVINSINSVRDDSSLNDFIFVMENLEVLSTTDFNKIGIDCTQLMKCICNFWEFTYSTKLVDNNAFKYFIGKLCKITSIFMSEINRKELTMILKQLKSLSVNDCYKITACEALSLLSKRKSQYNQDECKINTLVVDIIYPNLLSTNKPVIRQSVLELIDNFANNVKQDIVETIVAKDLNGEVTNYLRKIVTPCKLDKEYLTKLGSMEFQHECIKWRDDIQRQPKKLKLSEPTFKESSKRKKEKQVNEQIKIISAAELETKNLQMYHDSGNVEDVISNIKGEVKCLLKVLKSEKLSAKNASDLKLIANQILSLM